MTKASVIAPLMALLSSLWLPACGKSFDEKFGGNTWESEHFRYRWKKDDPRVCEAVMGRLETYAKLIASALQVDESALGVSNYYKYPNQASFPDVEICGTQALACADSDEVAGALPLMGHELVHNVMAKRTGMGVSVLLMEGLANALTCDPGTIGTYRWDFRTFDAEEPDIEDVTGAGRLIASLLQHVELRDVMDMIAAIDKTVSLEDTRTRILERWGLDLDVLRKEIEATQVGACAPLYACSGPPLSEGDTTVHVNCAGFDPVTLPTDGEAIGLRVSRQPMLLIPCDFRQAKSPLARLAPYRVEGNWEYWLESPIAKHALWIDGVERLDFDVDANVSMRHTPHLFAKDCSTITAESLEPGEQIAVVVMGDEGVTHFPLEFGQAVPLRLHWQSGNAYDNFGGPDTPVQVDWCSRCENGVATDCAILSELIGGGQTVQTNGQGVLVLRPLGALRRAAVLEITPLYP